MSAPETAVELAGRKFDWPELLNEALETPGTIGSQYNAFWPYSFMNRLLLYMQGCKEPAASFARWKALDRYPMKGSGLIIVRPITIKREDANGDPVSFLRFKPVRGAFPFSRTTGKPLVIPETTDWSIDRAYKKHDIEMVPFTQHDGNIQGYSFGRNVALNPVAKSPLKTLAHEGMHVLDGHTVPEAHDDYIQHRGIKEFIAEAGALLVVKEVGLCDAQQESESRGYCQGWLRDERPSDRAIRAVFKGADMLIRAGQVELAEVTE